MNRNEAKRAGPLGRTARLVMATCIAVITLPVYVRASSTYVMASLGLALGLVVMYVALHGLISRYLEGRNRWGLSGLAVLPVLAVWLFGQGGGLLFGQGEGGTAALTYLTISFLVDALTGSAGCEVLAVPSVIFRTRPDVPCLLLCPIDHAEEAGTNRPAG